MPVQIWPDSKGKVAIGKAKYLLNIMINHLDVQLVSFPRELFYKLVNVKEYSLTVKHKASNFKFSVQI